MTTRVYPKNVPVITKGIKILWEAGRYDGPLSAIVEYQGQKCFADMKHEYQSKKLREKVYRTYWVYKLTQDQWEELEYWHNEFRLHVGTHCDYSFNIEYGYYTRGDRFVADMEYCKEMFYERYKLFQEECANKNIALAVSRIDKATQTIGWITSDVLVGRPFTEWRRSCVKREEKNS